jgi:hypothetical protein
MKAWAVWPDPLRSVHLVDRSSGSGHTHHALSPWLSLVDPNQFAQTVDRVQAYQPNAIASSTAPTSPAPASIRYSRRPADCRPGNPLPHPDQVVLDHIVSTVAE